MKTLTGQSFLPVFKELYTKVLEESGIETTWTEISVKELDILAEIISKTSKAKISGEALRDYRYMCLERPKYPLKVRFDKLELLCGYANFDISTFEQPPKDENEIRIVITEDFFEEGNANVAKRLLRRYGTIKEDYAVDDWQLQIETIKQVPYNKKEAKKLAHLNQADFILWGESVPWKSAMNYRLMVVNPQRYWIDNEKDDMIYSYQKITDLSEICESDFILEPEYLLFFALAAMTYKTQLDAKALKLWKKVSELRKQIADPYFYMGVIHHLAHRWEEAILCYEQASEFPALGNDTHEKNSFNKVLLHMYRAEASDLEIARHILEKEIRDEHPYVKEYQALRYRLYSLLKEEEKAFQALQAWENTSLQNYHAKKRSIGQESFSTKADYLLIQGSERVSILFEQQKLNLTSALLNSRDRLMSQGGDIRLYAIKLHNHLPVTIDVKEEPEQVIRLAKELPEFAVKRHDLFEFYKHEYPWMVLQPTYVPIYDPYAMDFEYTLQFRYNDKFTKHSLPIKDGCFLMDSRNILRETDGQSFIPHQLFEDVRVNIYNPFDDELKILYLKGLVFMDNYHFMQLVVNFQSQFPRLKPSSLEQKTASFIYQAFGAIPLRHLINPL
ncbi:hypothetical protein QQ020_21750 [Fulvivirgaceae bacterium BMA12]|uniref:Tetratricopeptide repeat protein n=1 Tax=Agaribacillus aureus TaxID=3051825 RepID=A0ABT8LAM0_9BACT|nr:hypothetical protein [Fulvivirgaceae bacterium BMA12]